MTRQQAVKAAVMLNKMQDLALEMAYEAMEWKGKFASFTRRELAGLTPEMIMGFPARFAVKLVYLEKGFVGLNLHLKKNCKTRSKSTK